MALADTYKRRCRDCRARISMAYDYCPWCGERQLSTSTALERLETTDEGHGRSYNGP